MPLFDINKDLEFCAPIYYMNNYFLASSFVISLADRHRYTTVLRFRDQPR